MRRLAKKSHLLSFLIVVSLAVISTVFYNYHTTDWHVESEKNRYSVTLEESIKLVPPKVPEYRPDNYSKSDWQNPDPPLASKVESAKNLYSGTLEELIELVSPKDPNCRPDSSTSDPYSQLDNSTFTSLAKLLLSYRQQHIRWRKFLLEGNIDKIRTLTWYCDDGCGGLGDRVRSIGFSLMLAMISNRLLFIQWREPFEVERQKNIFEPAAIDWTQEKHPEGKVLIIGGGIANFTNVAATFKGIVRALKEFKHLLIEYNISIFVRRGGPNYQEGLRVMRDVGSELGVPMHVFGPETHMTAIVAMALGKRPVPRSQVPEQQTSSLIPKVSPSPSLGSLNGDSEPARSYSPQLSHPVKVQVWDKSQEEVAKCPQSLFTPETRAIIYGMQPRACQGMLDFDYLCSRKTPSVAAMVYPFSGNHKQKFYFGMKEIMIPVYKELSEAVAKNPDADVLVNFASLRSAYDSTIEVLELPQICTIAIIAEGIPENKTKLLIKKAKERGVTIIGPATVGGIKPGCFKIGNTGGMTDNIIASKLYRPGSVAYVSRSGGMSNELNNIISRKSNGVYEGVAIGGDRYPGSTFIDHVLRFHDNPDVKMIVLLGEVGGVEEYEICKALKTGRIFKPVVAWCIGTCAKMFTSEVQFGHAGACANASGETADAKNKALAEAGAFVPDSFDLLGVMIGEVYSQLVKSGKVVPQPEKEPPTVPMDYKWAQELGLIRKPASVMSSICDERGEELLYAGMPISDVFKENIGIGGVLSLLWFQRRLPDYACKFLEICLMVTADHGPAVSGAHNTIVAARAGKDLVSSLASGLLTVGDRFGGALDESARQFSHAFDAGLIPMDFVNKMKKENKLIMGIGHRVKSLNNPDMRVVIIKEFAKANFPATPLLDYALEVEKITTSKKPNLILNVDGVIATCFVDLVRHSKAFTPEEGQEYIEIGTLNGLFVLGRTMGFIGHYLDQKRLKQGLYRHPWDDIAYIAPEELLS